MPMSRLSLQAFLNSTREKPLIPRLSLVALGLVLVGCSSLPMWSTSTQQPTRQAGFNNWNPRPDLQDQEVSLVIYRSAQSLPDPVDVYINDQPFFKLQNGTFGQAILCSGENRVGYAPSSKTSLNSVNSNATLQVPNGQFRVFELVDSWNGSYQLISRNPDSVKLREALKPSVTSILRIDGSCAGQSTMPKTPLEVPSAVTAKPVAQVAPPATVTGPKEITRTLPSMTTTKQVSSDEASQDVSLNIVVDVLFGLGKSDEQDVVAIRGKGSRLVNAFTEMLHREFSHVDTIRIIGYADPVGNSKANRTLSMERAQTIREALVRAGFGYADITTEAKGATQQTIQNCPTTKGPARDNCNMVNRRVEVQIKGTPTSR